MLNINIKQEKADERKAYWIDKDVHSFRLYLYTTETVIYTLLQFFVCRNFLDRPLLVIWNGLPLDLSLAGYLTAIPGLLFIASAWTLSKTLRSIWNGYYFFIAILLAVIFIVALGLYEYWGFRLDATPLFYFFSSPKDAFASMNIWQMIGGIIAMIVYASLLYVIFLWVQRGIWRGLKLPYRRLSVSGVMLLLTALLFYPYPRWIHRFYNEYR